MNWVTVVYIPFLKEKRDLTGYDGPAVLILDGCSCHNKELLEALLEPYNATAYFIPPHSSDQLQMLDLGIFGVMKLRMSQIRTSASFSTWTRQIIRMFNGWQMSTLPINVVMAFRRGGFTVEWDVARQMNMVTVDARFAGKVRHLQQEDNFLIHRDRRRTAL